MKYVKIKSYNKEFMKQLNSECDKLWKKLSSIRLSNA